MISAKTAAYVRAVAEEGSFRRAAEKLYLSQPSLSECILKAEKAYGVQFFDRNVSPVALTYAGEVFLQEAEKIEHLDEQLTRKLSDLSNHASGRIVVGESPTMSARFIPQLFKTFQQKYPDVRLTLQEGSSRELIEDVRHGRADLAFVSWSHETEGLVFRPVVERPLLLAHAPMEKTAPGTIGKVSLKSLAEEPFILLKEGREIRALADDVFDLSGFRPKAAYETESYTLAARMAEAGLGWTFSVNTGDHTMPEQLQYFRIEEAEEIYHVSLVFRRDSYLSKPMQYFMELAENIDKK